MTIQEEIQQMINELNPKSYVRWIQNRPHLMSWITEKQIELHTNNIPETLFCITNNIIPPLCDCGSKVLFATFIKGYRKFCSFNCPIKGQIHSKTIKKMWKDNPTKLKEMVEKKEATNFLKYGFKNAINNKDVQDKARKTCQEKYGTDTPFESKEIQEKISNTNLKKYGVERPFQNKAILDKTIATFEKNHGEKNKMQLARSAWKLQNSGLNPFQTPEVKQKIQDYWQINYGVNHPNQVPQILAKCSETLMKNYGVTNPAQIGLPVESLLVLSDPTLLSKKLITYGLQTLSKQLKVRPELIVSYHHRLGLTILPKQTRSLLEDDVYTFLLTLGITVLRNDRKIISPYELDFVLPEYNLAIEFNGLYWHSEKAGMKDKKYHNMKFSNCVEKNFQLITIWEDEWINKSSIIKNHIRHLVQKTNKVIGARQLTIKAINLSEANIFLENTHIQGSVLSSKITLGAYFNNALISILTTSQIGTNPIAITRWSVDQQASYPGLLSKFISHLSQNYNITEIETIADLRWSIGKSYIASGFVLDHVIEPDYQYTDYVTRDHKFNLRKDKIKKRYNVDIEDKTEKELCELLGFDRIWDCGKLKFKWSQKSS